MVRAESDRIGVWFPAVRAGTGADVFTRSLCESLNARGIRAGIAWLPHRAEYLPWTVPVPEPPEWANVVHVNTWLHPRFIPRRLPVVATMHHVVHGQFAASHKSLLQEIYHRTWIFGVERKILSRADAVTAVSRFTADQTHRVFDIDGITVVPNWVDTDIFSPPPGRRPHRPFKLLYVGTWSARKGVDLLAPMMQALGVDFVLHYTDSNPRGTNARGLPDNCRCLGRLSIEELVGAMRDSDALVFPSRLEGFGLVAAEAMACGLPVVATRGSSLPEVVEDGVTGFLCPRDDVATFVQAIKRLEKDSVLWREMSSNANAHACNAFSEDVAIDAYSRVYRDAIDKYNEDTR